MPPILLAHAEGESALADSVAGPLRSAGYDVLYEGTLLVGDSLLQEVSKALEAGSPVVLCGTIAALGTGWAHQVVNAARRYPSARIFALQMEKLAYLQPLSLDGQIAAYWQDPDKAINNLLDAIRKYYPLKAGAEPSSVDQLERRYRDLALRTYDIVDLANLPVTDRGLATRELLLRSLYVALRVTIDTTLSSSVSSAQPGRSKSDEQESPSWEDEEEETSTRKRWPVGVRLAQSHRLVVLGDPGAGKSTLMRWIATAYLLRLNADPDWQKLPDVAALPDTDWLPILIRCRDLEDLTAVASLEQVLDHHLRKLGIIGAETGQLNELLLKRLSDGHALLLLDGLDEIAQPAARARFCRQIEQIHVAYPNAPIIVTSRIVGYREMGLRIGRGFEHTRVLDLTAEDKDEFVRRWCTVAEPITRRESTEQELIEDIHSTDRIERLTGNPMLLTTMALVKKNVGKLPSKRADLYREAVDVLLNWRSDVDELLDPYEAMPQLEYVAYAMCAAGIQRLRADEITRLLGEMRSEFPSVRAARRRSPLDFLQLLERRTGILIEIGKVRYKGRLVPAYEFRHLTFQEYLAGLALVEGRFPNRDREKSLAENASPLAGQTSAEGDSADLTIENWREALRLCVMSCNDDDVDSVLLAIANVREEEQASITARPRAALAISCLSDEPNVSEDVAVGLIDHLAGLLDKNDGESTPGETEPDDALYEVGASLWGPLAARRIAVAWKSRPDDDDSSYLCGCVATILSQSIPSDRETVEIWLQDMGIKLSSDDSIDRILAASALMEFGYQGGWATLQDHSDSINKFVRLLVNTLERPGCESDAAAWAIGWLSGPTSTRLSAEQQSLIMSSAMKKPVIHNNAIEWLTWGLDASNKAKLRSALSAK